MESVSIQLKDILWVLGFIVTASAAWAAVRKHPFFSHEKRIQTLEKHSKEQREMGKLTCRGVQCLLENARTGNSLINMREAEEDIRNFVDGMDEP